jgi:ssDNA-binding Zn-finger/Zn-ribbon topoisomerase 1
VEQPKDEFTDTPVTCPKCGKMAVSVNRTGNKIFYNHGDPKIVHTDNQGVEVTWSACEVDRPKATQKS